MQGSRGYAGAEDGGAEWCLADPRGSSQLDEMSSALAELHMQHHAAPRFRSWFRSTHPPCPAEQASPVHLAIALAFKLGLPLSLSPVARRVTTKGSPQVEYKRHQVGRCWRRRRRDWWSRPGLDRALSVGLSWSTMRPESPPRELPEGRDHHVDVRPRGRGFKSRLPDQALLAWLLKLGGRRRHTQGGLTVAV
jgi:hypothetical protein